MSELTRIRIVIRGAVQGVGFRPFVYRLADEHHLTGWVVNSNEGVAIEADGTKAQLEEFLLRVGREHPRHASIHSLEYSFLDPAGFTSFTIRDSETLGRKTALVLPDIATCPDCLHDIFDRTNRRHLYPFTNCTNCGPRFSIIESLPYDRTNTTMRAFTMCPQCMAEYQDPDDRRFHAQPNACPECGPQLALWDAAGLPIAAGEDGVRAAVDALKRGEVVAIKGLGGFHLMVDASNEDAVTRLRLLKHREEKPLALMAPSMDAVREICRVNPLEERALTSPEAPIVLLSKAARPGIAPSVAPGNPYFGVMLPYTPLHHILMREVRGTLVATSGNHSDEPIVTDEHDALRRLRGVTDFFLVHNRPIRRHADDSIVRVILDREQVLRRARGYAPLPVRVPVPVQPALGVGGHLKNTVTLADGNNVFISQHIGDLETKEAFDAFTGVIGDLQTLLEIRPQRIVTDQHPDYVSTAFANRLAKSHDIHIDRVQHHLAHVVSCMTENGITAPILGVAWDGTGYGTDGTIWGGEFLLIESDRFTRAGHFRTFPLPGADTAIRHPKHTAAGILFEIFGTTALEDLEPPLIRQMLEKDVRCPRTSSVGRLFDAVASLIGLRDRVSFEGQAAMELEFRAAPNVAERYEYVVREGGPLIVDWAPMIRQILDDVQSHNKVPTIAAKFHNTLAAIVADMARRIGQPRVVLSGGCFQNRYLTEQTVERLREAGFSAYWHQRVPPNDGGIALGQIMAAQHAVKQEKTCVLRSQAG